MSKAKMSLVAICSVVLVGCGATGLDQEPAPLGDPCASSSECWGAAPCCSLASGAKLNTCQPQPDTLYPGCAP